MKVNKIFIGDALESLKKLPDECVQTCVTSPPYFGLRDYGMKGQMGLEETPEAFVEKLVTLFREVKRTLRDDGTLWLNLGDSYATNAPNGFQGKNGGRKDRRFTAENLPAKKSPNLKPKDLIGIPWRVAFALQADGWYLRQDIIWAKPSPMPESVADRCTKAHEYIFLLSKSPTYYYDQDAIREKTGNEYSWEEYNARTGKGKDWQAGKNRKVTDLTEGMLRLTKKKDSGRCHPNGRNKRSVWTVASKPYKGAHFATFPPDLIEPCILAGAPVGAVVLDPFLGSGTTAAVAVKLGRQYIGCELNPEYVQLAQERLGAVQMQLAA